MPGKSYREVLKKYLVERMEENPRYSLRAFSRDLKISPSRLSEILKGKQGLSERWAIKIASSLGLTKQETINFRQLVLASDARSKSVRSAAQSLLEKQRQPELEILAADAFRVVSDWHHFAILELMKMKNWRSSPNWIAGRLGISEYEVKFAMDRLAHLGLVEKENGKWRSTNRSLTTACDIPSEAIRKFNRQILEKAKEAISLQRVEERDISTLTVAVRKADIPLVKEKIREFRRRLNKELTESVGPQDGEEVYSLAIQFFRLTTKEQR